MPELLPAHLGADHEGEPLPHQRGEEGQAGQLADHGGVVVRQEQEEAVVPHHPFMRRLGGLGAQRCHGEEAAFGRAGLFIPGEIILARPAVGQGHADGFVRAADLRPHVVLAAKPGA